MKLIKLTSKMLLITTSLMLSFSIAQASINVREEARVRSTSEISIARNLADNIARQRYEGATRLDAGLVQVMRTHSASRHGSGDTYFDTDNSDQVKQIINLVITNPSQYSIQYVSGSTRLAIERTISTTDAQRITGHDHIGLDAANIRASYNRVIVIFDIDGVNTLHDSLDHGAFFTAFPVRDTYVLR